MKKLFVLLLVGCAFVAFTSCKKTCTCTTYLDGAVVSTVEYDLGSYKNCAAMNTVVTMPPIGKTGMECK